MIKNLPAIQETWVWSLGQDDLLEKGMATHTSIIAWRNLQTEELGRLQSMGSQGAGHDWATNTHLCWCFSYYKSTRVKINNSSTIKLSFWFHFFNENIDVYFFINSIVRYILFVASLYIFLYTEHLHMLLCILLSITFLIICAPVYHMHSKV